MFYKKKIKKLQEVQKELYKIREKLKINMFPRSFVLERKSCIGNLTIREDLAETIILIFEGRASLESLEKFCDKTFKLGDAKDYFEKLGHYFINLSGNLDGRKELEEKVEKLEKEEQELKRKLGID